MDEAVRKEDPSLPPDYVSLAQLQERWLKKKQEKKLREREEEERKEREASAQNENQNRSDWHEKMAGLSLRDVPRRRVEGYGREMGVTVEKGKGKEIVIGGTENGGNKTKTKKKKKKKKKSLNKNKKKPGSRNGLENEKLESEIKEFDGGDGCEGNEVTVGIHGVLSEKNSGRGENHGGLKGAEEIGSVAMMEVLPRKGVKTMDFGGGFRTNGASRGPRCDRGRKEYSVRVKFKETEVRLAVGKNMEGEKGDSRKWRRRGTNGGYRRSCYRLKQSRIDISKGNEMEPESGHKAEDHILEVCSDNGGLDERDRNQTKEDNIEGEEGLEDNCVAMEKKVDNEVSCSILKDNEFESELGKKEADGIVEVDSELGYLSERNKTEEDTVEGEGLNDNGVAMEEEEDNRVLVEESVKNVGNGYRRHGNWRGNIRTKYNRIASNDLKTGNVGDGMRDRRYGRFEDRGKTGNVGDGRRYSSYVRFEGHGKIGNIGDGRRYSSYGRFEGHGKIGNIGDGRRYSSYGRLEGRWKTKQRESGMMWVKKEEKSGADTAEVGSSGTSVDQA